MHSRRDLIRLAGGVLAGARLARAETVSLFDGRTLNGWIQIENSATSLPAGDIIDPAAFIGRLLKSPMGENLPAPLKADLASYSASSANAKAVVSALAKELNQEIAGDRRKRVVLEAAFPSDIKKSSLTGWMVKDGAMASTGAGRGVIYTAQDFGRYRLMFTMRHVSGAPDHQAGVLIFCTPPQPGEKPLDALGGIQFQVPNGGHWDYRPGMNHNGGAEFTSLTKTRFDFHDWSRVEIVADASQGTARMSVAQPVGSKAVEVLAFQDRAAGKVGPIAWQMHNGGLFDEFKDIVIEVER